MPFLFSRGALIKQIVYERFFFYVATKENWKKRRVLPDRATFGDGKRARKQKNKQIRLNQHKIHL